MNPTLLSFGPFEFHAYTVATAIAFLVGVLCAVRENYKLDEPFNVTPAGGVWIFFFALLGAKVYWYLQYGLTWVDNEGHPYQWYRVFFLWEGGQVFFGGLIGGIFGGVAYIKYKRVPFLKMGDVGLPFLPLGHSIARLGCFFNGCCWGRVTDGPTGIRFPKYSLAWKQHVAEGLIPRSAEYSLPVHPTELYESAGLFCIFLIMRYAYKHKKYDGSIVLLYPLLYGILRFTDESFRGESVHSVFGMTVSQAVALTMFLCAACAYAILFQTVWRAPVAVTPPMEDESK